jgi:hypothetical protein
MADSFPYDVFLSHNAQDKPRVRRLVPVSQLSTVNSQPVCTAVHRDPANAGRRFIPLLLGDCALPDTLRRYKVVPQITANVHQSRTLATLRYTLLPKLLSGRIAVSP